MSSTDRTSFFLLCIWFAIQAPNKQASVHTFMAQRSW
jgi:hypothetical protein